jgi:hypothetical protein
MFCGQKEDLNISYKVQTPNIKREKNKKCDTCLVNKLLQYNTNVFSFKLSRNDANLIMIERGCYRISYFFSVSDVFSLSRSFGRQSEPSSSRAGIQKFFHPADTGANSESSLPQSHDPGTGKKIQDV